MPRISEFYGIVIYMYWDDHSAPHFHAYYAEHRAKVLVATGGFMAGALPAAAARRVRQWTTTHRSELDANWELARMDRPLIPIEPLA